MKTNGVRIYGQRDLRLESFELPPLGKDELLVKIVSDSLCMSSYKAAEQGANHKRVPDDIAQNPTIIGHECCGEIVEVGADWQAKFKAGQRFSIQPAMKGTYDAAGYSFRWMGGDSQYGIIPACYLEQDCILPYSGDAFFSGSLAEPLSCVIGAAHANYHTTQGEYTHKMEIVPGGKMAILAGAGPMGLALIDYILHRKLAAEHKPSLLVVTDIDDARLNRAAQLLSPAEAEKLGVKLVYRNTGNAADPVAQLKALAGGDGYDDVFVFAPVPAVVEQGDAILGHDGCLNFFAGPTDTAFSAKFNFYNVHYNATHIVGTSGGNTNDMREALELAAEGCINPAILVTHIGGIDAVVDATLNLPKIPGGKKLIYNHISMPLTAIDDFAQLGKTNPLFQKLAELCDANAGLWNAEAEAYLLANAPAYTG
ncbi:zinc-binding dehydrogenase [Ruminococcaceae bacterium OttesenSCG-928-L11]|nr:zinc-binding dehydrogenase [Ruminococcaceae bacterium OttesenSCG-928-L11]